MFISGLVESAMHLAIEQHDHLFTSVYNEQKRFTVHSHAIDPSGIPLTEKVVRCNIPFYSEPPDSLARNRLQSVRFALCAECTE